jgi:hypothetical protein
MRKYKTVTRYYSERMIQTLRHIYTYGLNFAEARQVNQMTLWSLLNRGLVARKGQSISTTPAGSQVVGNFDKKELAQRVHEKDLSYRVQVLLRLVRAQSKRAA